MKKIKLIKPFQMSDAGISCCCMLLGYYGAKYSIVELKNEVDVGRDGIVWKDIEKIFSNKNVNIKVMNTLEYSKRHIVKFEPFIAQVCKDYVVVESIESDIVTVCDPIKGKYTIDAESFWQIVENQIMFIEPDKNFKKINRKYFFWKYYYKDIFKNKKLVLAVFIFSVISYLLNIVSPILLQKVTDSVVQNRNDLINQYIIIFIVTIIVGAIVNYYKGYSLIGFRMSIDRNISKNAIKKLLFIPYKYYESRTNSEIIYGIGCCGTIREVFATQLVNGIIDLGASFFLITYIFKSSFNLGITACLMFLINALLIIVTTPQMMAANRAYINEQAELNGVQIEVVNTIQSIKMSAMEKETFNLWKNKFKDFQTKYASSQKIVNRITTTTTAVRTASPFVMLLMAIKLYQCGQLTIGEVLASYSLSNTFFCMAASIFSSYWGFTQSNIYMERMSDIVSQKIEEYDEREKIEVEGNISLKNVGFSYKENGNKILSDISLDIKAGEKIAIVGKSGCGKSTLAKLFVGLYKPTSGEIIYEGINQNALDMSYVCSKLGIISQEATLFNKTVFDNIKMNRNSVSEEDVIKAAMIVGIHNEIENMPMKYNTMVSDLGGNFSGGQRQRIVLARAIASNPKLIVMDEATSALDNINEQKVTRYLRNIGSTQIIIAHRFSSIIDADRIVVLNNGRIEGIGTHEELLNSNEYYMKLYKGNNVEENSVNTNDKNILDHYRKKQILFNSMKICKSNKSSVSKGVVTVLLTSIMLVTILGCKLINRKETNVHIDSIVWKDKAIARYVETSLGKKTQDVTKEQLCLIRKISINHENIVSLEDLKKFPNLEELELTNSEITDISEVGELSNIKILKLSNNNINSIERLVNLDKLKMLYLDGNNISSASYLNDLDSLEYVDLSDNNILDWEKVNCDANIRKCKYDVAVTFEYCRNNRDYSGWQVEVWNSDTNKQIYNFDNLGVAKCTFETNDHVMAFRLLNKNGLLVKENHVRYFDIGYLEKNNIKVTLRQNISEFKIQ